MSGRILAKSLVPEPKTSLKCPITSLVSGTKLRFSKKKFTFSNSLSREPLEAHHSPPLFAAAYGESFREHAPQALMRWGIRAVVAEEKDERVLSHTQLLKLIHHVTE